MESLKVLVGDHTGVIKFIDSDIRSIGSAGKNKSILNLIQQDDVFWSVHQDGMIQEFDETGQFNQIRPSSNKIISGFSASSVPCVVFQDGQIDIGGSLVKSSQETCFGTSLWNIDLGLCGRSPLEIWDLRTMTQKWKGWTVKPKDEVYDNQCWLQENLALTITANNEIMRFDLRAGKKPRNVAQLNKPGSTFFYPLQSIFCDENFVLVGDNAGQVYKLNQEFKVLGKTKGRSTGTVLSIASKMGKVFTCGMDRRLMIHDLATMNLIDKKYLWQKLTKVIVVE